jgi:hypothetical protein
MTRPFFKTRFDDSRVADEVRTIKAPLGAGLAGCSSSLESGVRVCQRGHGTPVVKGRN